MATRLIPLAVRPSLTLRLTWLLVLGVAAVTIENIWLDPWLTSTFRGFPSLVPEPPSALWMLTFAVIGIVCTVLVIGQILLIRRAGVSLQAKVMAGVAVLAAILLSIVWFRVTSGISPAPRFAFASAPARPHSVSLTWQPSFTPTVVGYNVFRYDLPNGPRTQINTTGLIKDTRTNDPSVVSGHSYKYVAQAVDIRGNPSTDSAPAFAGPIP